MNKTVKIGPNSYKMFDYPSGWIFVKGTSSRTKGQSYPVAKVHNNTVVALEPVDALGTPTNEELARAWVNS